MRRLTTMLFLIGLTGIFVSGMAGADEHGSRRAAEKKAEEISENFEKRIARLEEEASGLTGEARAEAEARIERAREKGAAVRRDLVRMKQGDDESGMAEKSWDQMKAMTRSGYEAAEEAYNEAAVYLGLKASQADPEGRAELAKRIENYMGSLTNRLQSARESAKELPGDSRAEAEKLVVTVREKWDRADQELARMKDAGAEAGQDAWSGLKDEMSAALDELNRAYRSAADFLWGEGS